MFGIPFFLIFDSDSNAKPEELSDHKEKNRWLLDICDSRIGEFPPTTIGDCFCIIEEEYEEYLRKIDPDYKSIEDEASREYGAGGKKGIRGRFTASLYGEKGISPPKIIKDLIKAIYDKRSSSI